MDIRKGATACFVFSIMCTCLGQAQDQARIETTQGVITAGDRLELKVTLPFPKACEGVVYVFFREMKAEEGFQLFSNATNGATEVTIAGPVPKDIPGGEYKSTGAEMPPCPGYSKPTQLKVTETTVTVKAFPNPVPSPDSAEVKLSLTQTQFLQTEMTSLSALKGQLDTMVEQNSGDPSEVRRLLIEILNQAEDELTASAKQYQEHIVHSQDKLPLFFADFHDQYQALRKLLEAQIPANGQSLAAAPAKLVYVQQLQSRPHLDDLATAESPDVDKLRHLIKDNAKAYSIVKDTGRAVFHASLSSYPMKARISYKNALDDRYMDYSSPTNVSWATFDLAYWDFKFHLDGCSGDQFRRINPYEENDPADISVEFNRCKSR